MRLNDFSLMNEDNDHYMVGHPKGQSIKVPKKGLSDKAHELITRLKKHQDLAEGTPDGTETAKDGTPSEDQLRYERDLASLPTTPEAGSQLPPPVLASEQRAQGEQPVPGIKASDEIGANPPVPTTPAPTEAVPNQELSNIAKSYGTEPIQKAEKDIRGGVIAEAKAAKEQSNILNQAAKDVQTLQNELNTRVDNYNKQDATFAKDIRDNKIDPDRYWNNMSTGSRIASVIGMVLGGLGGGNSGAPNSALGMINKSIENDIAAQMNEQTKGMNLWKMNREALQNDRAATLATQSQLLNIAKVKAEAAQSLAQGAIAKSRMAPVILGLDQQIQASNRMRSALDLANKPTPGGGLIQAEPTQLVDILVQHPEDRKEVLKEIKAAQKVKKLTPKILEAFDRASEAGFAKTVPGLHSAGQKAFMGLINTTVEGLEGTTREAAFKSIENNMMPSFGDSDETIRSKRQGVMDYLTSDEFSPTAKANKIDLSKFASTSMRGEAASQYKPGQTVEVKGQGKFKVGQNGDLIPIK